MVRSESAWSAVTSRKERNTAPSATPGEIPDAGGYSLISGHPRKCPAGDDLGDFIVQTDTDPRGCAQCFVCVVY